ncbi:hypothetical protein H5410_013878 [Solanum commersonii]|uniref:Uncharacterized protein n=1 Tax=Solanum commersonii TaxID=4109 RepID=A0A9J5ZPF2_SOLCO|nr:hypothetical protein H5410_013878 [Solanum commersonii]
MRGGVSESFRLDLLLVVFILFLYAALAGQTISAPRPYLSDVLIPLHLLLLESVVLLCIALDIKGEKCLQESSCSSLNNLKGSLIMDIKEDTLLLETSPTAAPQPLLPLLAPSPLAPFTNSTSPKLSGLFQKLITLKFLVLSVE